MDKVIRWGILGTGQIARAMAFALQEAAGAKLVAVASRSGAGAEKFGREFGIKRCHGSYQALADDADVDVIYIATPHALHAANALMCLNGGKHVLCEKAFTMNRREAAEVVALARQKRLFLMEAMWSRFLPAIGEARRIIDSGEIGKVTQIQSDFGFVPQVPPEHRLLNPELGGGALLDIGIYPLSLSAFFLGPVESVQAIAELGPTGVDEQTAFSLRHQGGGVSSCVCSIRAHTPIEMTISGPLGYIRIHNRFFQAQTLTIATADGNARTVEFPHIGSGYAYEAVEVMRCLNAGLIESPLMPHAETLALMGILDTIRAQIGVSYGADKV
ncbi:Gfo/Idh/MocA family protein [Janthinobacterium fluminis]|uniref:Gfo/Idh/MocA family oxidoreductase n=1 Tax=Janthinobacterium fluminis TaxID=2987524 RepID=A0ABT5K365_9BURK|nr:Gfo/Idh/MocA family oxidoreductase [Janthinobacterium fluminis]MDC8759421.1 Gfo/Idh/MocA family oxidoreductase [Janthinobacterium fluminis]